MKNIIKHILKSIILFSIQLIEKYEYKKFNLNENNFHYKIIDSIKLNDIKVYTPQGYKLLLYIHKTQPYHIWNIILENGMYLEAADNHILINSFNEQIFLKNIKIGDNILTKEGPQKVVKLKKSFFKISMYDISIDSNEHLFYSNNIISHNTTTVSAYFAWHLCTHVDKSLAILANKNDTAKEIVSKVLDIFKGLPFFLKPGIINFGALGMRLDNGCQLLSQATTKTAQIGFTIHVLYADEFAHIQNNIVDDFWRSVYPTLASSMISQCIISSTPNGQQNLFFDLWDKANKEENSFAPIRVDYWEVPEHDDKWAEQMKRDFGEERFAQEFELQFTVNSNLLLGAKQLSFIKRIEKEYVFRDLSKTSLDEELYRNLKWDPNFDPDKEFHDNRERFVLIIDTGEGKDDEELQDNDYNVISIYKIEPKSFVSLNKLRSDERQLRNMFRFRQIGIYRDNFRDAEVVAKVCKAIVFDQLGENICRILVEVNFDGKSFISKFADHDKFYDDLLFRTHHRKPIIGDKNQIKKAGFKVGIDKEYYCKLGKRLIGEKTIIPNDTVTVKEFSSFGKDKKGKYRGLASHDDTVMCTLNISRLYEDQSYEDMLYDFLEEYEDIDIRKKIKNLLEINEENLDISDSMFKSMYMNDDRNNEKI